MIQHTNNSVGSFSLTLGRFFSHRTHRFNRLFCAQSRTHRTPPAYRIHRTLLQKMGVTFCAICRPQGLCEPCVFCSSVFFCEKEKTLETCRRLFSLAEHTEFTEVLGTRFDPTREGDSIYLALAKRRVNGRVVGSCGQKNGIKMC